MAKTPTERATLEALAAKARDELARRDLPTYVDAVHRLPTYPHMQEWADALMDDTITNLLIVCPPGFGKTNWISIFYPCWYIGRNPQKHVILASNTANQAYKPSVAVRSVVAFNKDYARIFPHVRPDLDKGWGQGEWFIKRDNDADKDATLFAVGVGGPIIGARGDLLILDDVCDMENTSSEAQREKVWEWVRDSAFSRLTQGGRIVCIMTRWAELDLASKFLNDPAWAVIHMPAVGYWGKDTSLCPEIRTIEGLLEIKRTRGALTFEKMYQGNPTVPEGNLIKIAWWKRIPEAQMPSKLEWEIVIQAWDTAFKTGQENDYCVCTTMARYKGNIFILGMFRKKMEWPELLKMSRELYLQCEPRPRVVLIEDKASGISLLQNLRSSVQPSIPVMPFKADNDPVARINAYSGYVETGRVWLPEGPMSNPWVDVFLSELSGFPSAAHDDICMSWVGGMQYLTAGDKFEPLDSGMLITQARQGEIPVGGDGWGDLPGCQEMSDMLREVF